MHDPDVVAFTIVRPWPRKTGLPPTGRDVRWAIRMHHDHHQPYCGQNNCTGNPFPWWKPRSYSRFWTVAGRDIYWDSLITVWHHEPGGADALTVCRNRVQRRDGSWKFTRAWAWHVRHWRIQFDLGQEIRRRLLTRCEWCGGRSVKADPVNCSTGGWDAPGEKRWWRGETGLVHSECHSVQHAHRLCLCAVPVLPDATTVGGSDYGTCLVCGRFRPWRFVPDDANRILASLPAGARPTPAMRAALDKIYAEKQATERQEAGNS